MYDVYRKITDEIEREGRDIKGWIKSKEVYKNESSSLNVSTNNKSLISKLSFGGLTV